MIFGYATAALGGFFLTAVPNWTGAKAAPAALHRCWSRACGWRGGWRSVWPPAPGGGRGVDLAFLPVLAANLLTQLIKRPEAAEHDVHAADPHAYWIGNLLVHLEWMGLTGDTGWQGLRGGLLTLRDDHGAGWPRHPGLHPQRHGAVEGAHRACRSNPAAGMAGPSRWPS
jgi:uncharacterized protein involved in response to NO